MLLIIKLFKCSSREALKCTPISLVTDIFVIQQPNQVRQDDTTFTIVQNYVMPPKKEKKCTGRTDRRL